MAQALCAQRLAPAAAAAALWPPRWLLLFQRPLKWQPLAAAAPDNAGEEMAQAGVISALNICFMRLFLGSRNKLR